MSFLGRLVHRVLWSLKGSYKKAPFFSETYPLLEASLDTEHVNLFDFLFDTLGSVLEHLEIRTQLTISSSLGDFSELKSTEKVLAICDALSAQSYLNPIGGTTLYDKNEFESRGVSLAFLQARPVSYPQYKNEFQAFLSIIDVLMFNGKATTHEMINSEYDIL